MGPKDRRPETIGFRPYPSRRRLIKAALLTIVWLTAASAVLPDHADGRLQDGAAAPAISSPGPQTGQLAAVAAAGTAAIASPSASEPSFGNGEKRKRRKKRARAAATSWVELQRRYPGSFIIGGPRNLRRVALTFDDVPDPRYTPKVLDILARYKVQATFFVVGYRAAQYPEIVRRISREGHTIGNHSYDHAVFSRISKSSFQRQVDRTDEILRPLAGYSPRLLRPPYGEILPAQIEWLKRRGYVVVNWDVDSVDWRGIDNRQILVNIKKTLQPGSIILQHAGGGVGQDLSGTLKALPQLITLLRVKGYTIVPLEELLGTRAARRPAMQ